MDTVRGGVECQEFYHNLKYKYISRRPTVAERSKASVLRSWMRKWVRISANLVFLLWTED